MIATTELYHQHLGNFEMAVAVGFVILTLSLSRFLKLRLETEIFVASVRTALQLSLVGFVLGWFFKTNSLIGNLSALFVMSLVAAQALYSRLRYKSLKILVLAFATLILSVIPSGLLTLGFIFHSESLQDSGFFIPFMGVLMGNTLSAISLAFLALEKITHESWTEIENFMALGASPWEACHRLYREVFRGGLTPLLNGMTVVGVVSLPGIMAGQLMGGVNPLTAARFQIFVMFLMLLSSMIGIFVAVLFHHFQILPRWLISRPSQMALDIQPHERWFLTGPSGSGKSRLMKSWVGLDHPEIQNFHENLPRPKTSALWHQISYLPQKAFFTAGTVKENLLWPFRFRKNATHHFDLAKIEAWLQQLGLPAEILNQEATRLSGGESQILHLLRTLQLNPDLFYLDEPTSALDPVRRQKLEDFFLQWTEDHKALVMISHSEEQVKKLATRVLRVGT